MPLFVCKEGFKKLSLGLTVGAFVCQVDLNRSDSNVPTNPTIVANGLAIIPNLVAASSSEETTPRISIINSLGNEIPPLSPIGKDAHANGLISKFWNGVKVEFTTLPAAK